MSLFCLPAEVRLMIYRELRTFQSPMIPPLPPKAWRESRDMGYCSYGFRWPILATNRQIYTEARQVFYAENDWTFFIAPVFPFELAAFMRSPLANGIHLIRRVHIRFQLFHFLFMHNEREPHGSFNFFQQALREVCTMLSAAHSLKSVKLVWTETSNIPAFNGFNHYTYPTGYTANFLQPLVLKVLRPLMDLQYPCPIQRSVVMVQFLGGERARAMEVAFANAADTLIALRESIALNHKDEEQSKAFKKNRHWDRGEALMVVGDQNI